MEDRQVSQLEKAQSKGEEESKPMKPRITARQVDESSINALDVAECMSQPDLSELSTEKRKLALSFHQKTFCDGDWMSIKAEIVRIEKGGIVPFSLDLPEDVIKSDKAESTAVNRAIVRVVDPPDYLNSILTINILEGGNEFRWRDVGRVFSCEVKEQWLTPSYRHNAGGKKGDAVDVEIQLIPRMLRNISWK